MKTFIQTIILFGMAFVVYYFGKLFNDTVATTLLIVYICFICTALSQALIKIEALENKAKTNCWNCDND